MKTANHAPSQSSTKNTRPLQHLAIIMDGNGRWAKLKGLSRSAGHKAGTKTAQQIVEQCVALEIPYLTLYTFSKENWQRPQEEVRFLFDLLTDFITKELPSLFQKNVKLNILGDYEALPFTCKKVLSHAINKTKSCNKMTLNLALNYSGRDEIARACRLCIEAGHTANDITPELISQYLYTAGQPDPDLVIRTSGEQRTSNFLPFQTTYSEYYFTSIYWPDFSITDLQTALTSFTERNRRFGDMQ